MEKADKMISNLTTNELISRKESLKNKFEVTKTKIIKLYDELDKMDEEYLKINKELKRRGI